MLRHISRVAVLLLVASLLAACAKDEPDTAAEDFYWAVAAGDVGRALGLISFADVPAEEKIQAEGKFQTLIGEMHSQISAKEGLSEVEILETSADEYDDKKARVRVRLTFGNGEEQEDDLTLVREDGRWKIALGL